MTISQAVSLVKLISNELGWAPALTDPRPIKKVREFEAKKLLAKIEEKPALYTRRNLELAVAYMRRTRVTPRSPVAVIYFVEKALAAAYTPDERPLGDRVDEAIRLEYAHEQPGWDDWTRRLNNAYGDYRQEVLDEWASERAALCQ